MNSAPLLAPKPFREYSPQEFRTYVKSLYEVTQSGSGQKVAPKPYSATRTKKGHLQIRVRRDPKWLSEAEVLEIRKSLSLSAAEIFLELKKREIRISSQAAEDASAKKKGEVHWSP